MSSEHNKKELTIITTHFNPDYDAVGSMVAARTLYPGSILVFPGGSEKNLRHFFVQSLIHLLEPVKVKDVNLNQVTRLVIVDTRQASRIGDVQAVLKNEGLDIHLYDHHPDAPGDLKGSVEIVEKVGATVTILTELIKEREIEILPEEATMIAVGLYEDTGSFTFNSTTERDYMAGAELLKRGADLSVVSQLTVRELTPEQLALLNQMVDAAESHQVQGFSLVISMVQIEYYIDDVAVLAHKLMEIMGISILFVLLGMENKVQLVIRSRLGMINASEVAREFGGGGHPSAAAASIKDMSLLQAKEKLDEILAEKLGTFYRAKNMMVSPPITVYEGQNLEEARNILIKFSINALLVVDHDEKVVGFISEHNVTKALHHGLLDYPISAFMNSEFTAVGPEASFMEIKHILVDRKQRVLPVVENNIAIGVITRTDLLQVLAWTDSDLGATAGVSPARLDSGRRNVLSLMREKFDPLLLDFLAKLGILADKLEVGLYAVGGCVRDLLLRQPSHDIDLSLDGDIDQFIALVQHSHNISKIIRHPRFQTATIETSEGFQIDISMTRREFYERPGALPEVEISSLRMDLYRRDFTINSMAISLNSQNLGELMDFFRGYQDIKEGFIRVLHNLSFVEDPTRAFRAVRFEARLGFRISKMTVNLLEGAVKGHFLTNIDRRRLLSELQLILNEEDPAPAIKRLNDFKLLAFIHPKIVLGSADEKFFTRVRRVRDWLALTFPEKLPLAWFVYFMALTERLNPKELSELASSLILKKKDSQILVVERPKADEIVKRYRKFLKPMKASEIYLLFKDFSWTSILYIMAKTENNDLLQAGVSYLSTYRDLKPLNSGCDIMKALNIKQGPRVREALEKIRLARLNGLVESKDEEIAFLASQAIAPSNDS